MEENKNLTAERSLEIIRESIERSQRTIARNSSWSMMWWGMLVVVFSLLTAFLWKNYGGPVWNFLWAAMWVIGYVGEWVIERYKDPVPTTFVSKTIGYVWSTFGVFVGSVGLILGLIGGGILSWELVMPNVFIFGGITSIICLCFGIATTITGAVVKNRVIQVCGLVAGLGGFFGALHFLDHRQLFVMAAVGVVGLVVPGLIIRVQNND